MKKPGLSLLVWLVLSLPTIGTVEASANAPLPDVAGVAKHGVRLDLGLGSATGILGVSAWRSMTPHLVAEAGTGWGASGLQLSGLLKLRSDGQRHRLFGALGPSLGLPVGTPGVRNSRGENLVMPWVNTGVGYEYIAPSGFVFIAECGATFPLRRADINLGFERSLDFQPGRPLPQVRIGFG